MHHVTPGLRGWPRRSTDWSPSGCCWPRMATGWRSQRAIRGTCTESCRSYISRRERLVMVEPRDASLVLITLRAAEEVRTPSFATADTAVDADMMAVGSMIIKRRSGHFDPT